MNIANFSIAQLFYITPPLAAFALNFTVYFQAVNLGCTIWIRKLLFTWIGCHEKIPPEKSPPWGVRSTVTVRLGIELGLVYGGLFSGGGEGFLEPMNRYFIFIHLQFYFCNFFFTRGDFNFDWLFFIKLISWNKTRPIFTKFDQTNLIKQKCVKFSCIHYQIYLIQ